jgi:serine protease Do
VIVKVDGVRLESGRQLPTLVAGLPPNKTVPIEVVRDGKARTLRVTVGEMPGDREATAAPGQGHEGEQGASELGLRIRPLEKGEIDRLRRDGVEHGVVVAGVKPGSPASGLLLQGDIIVEVNRQPTKSVQAFREAIESMKPGKSVLLRIFRNGSWIYLVIQV